MVNQTPNPGGAPTSPIAGNFFCVVEDGVLLAQGRILGPFQDCHLVEFAGDPPFRRMLLASQMAVFLLFPNIEQMNSFLANVLRPAAANDDPPEDPPEPEPEIEEDPDPAEERGTYIHLAARDDVDDEEEEDPPAPPPAAA